MYRGHRVSVVVPAFNEAERIAATIGSIPSFVDRIVVIDDASVDGTARICERLAEDRSDLTLLRHGVNRGVGAAIATGYLWSRENGVDISVVMAGDGQMDPADLPRLLDPIADGRADYAKGNRLGWPNARELIPTVRYFGIRVLSVATKFVSGYWKITDSQCGYTAISRAALERIPIESIYPRYGMPNDLLVTLGIHRLRAHDVPVRPVYGVGEKSKMKIVPVMFSISLLFSRLFARRIRAALRS